MISVGILYICTGPYSVFWPDFYKSCEEFFLTECHKTYYVFTDEDASSIKAISNNDNIVVIYKKAEPWPYPTLMRFQTFLDAQKTIEENDYLYFINANTLFVSKVTSDDVLPMSRELVIVQRPVQKKYLYTYERDPKSRAYIPYNCGDVYVQGGFIGSTTQIFLDVSNELNHRINEDLSNSIIAVWHDESHLNRLIAEGYPCRLLSTEEYCNPEDISISKNAKIVLRNKTKHFAVDKLKNNVRYILPIRVLRKTCRIIKGCAGYLRDVVLGKSIKNSYE